MLATVVVDLRTWCELEIQIVAISDLVLNKWHVGVVHCESCGEWLIDDGIADDNFANTCSKILFLADGYHVEESAESRACLEANKTYTIWNAATVGTMLISWFNINSLFIPPGVTIFTKVDTKVVAH